MIKKCLLIIFCFLSSAIARADYVLKFEGVPPTTATLLRKKFPFVTERPVRLSEVDDIMRFLMATRTFSSIETVQRDDGKDQELVLIAALARRITEIRLAGNTILNNSEILRILGIAKGQVFDRKSLLASADDLREEYSREGYLNTQIDIEFETPAEAELKVVVKLKEGPPCRVADVLFETPNPALSEKLKSFVKSIRKEILSEDNILAFQKKLNDYVQGNRYLITRLESPAIAYNPERILAKLTYLITQPFRYEFIFEGNRFFSEGALVKAMELEKVAGITTAPVTDLTEKVRRHYESNGFAFVEIEASEQQYDQLFKRVIKFAVKEGPRVRIKSMHVDGKISRPESYYVSYIRKHSSTLISKGFYNRKDMETGTKNLVAELQNQGYLKARVDAYKAEPSKDMEFMDISVSVLEGPITVVQQIRFSGATAFSYAQLQAAIPLRADARLSLRDIDESLTKLKQLYHNSGYLEMRIRNEAEGLVSYNEANTQAKIDFQIEEGPRITVAEISLQGNSFTQDEVILRELMFKKGDVLTPEKWQDSEFRLQSMGIFSRVEIRTLEEGTPVGERTVIVAVTERDPGLFTSGVGVTSEYNYTYRGNVGIAYRNLRGSGRGVSARLDLRYANDVDISFLENKVTFGYYEPYILNGHNRGRINASREQKFYNIERVDSQINTIIQEDDKIEFLAERNLTRNLKMTYTFWSFTNQRQFVRQTNTDVEIQNIGKTGPLFELDYRDHPFSPSKGNYTYLSAEYSDPNIGSSQDQKQTIHFAKGGFGTTHYTRLTEASRPLWVNSLRGGYVSNLSRASNSGVPSTEAFFLGGQSTIRGFDPNDIERLPSNAQLGVAKLRDFRVTADSYFFLAKTEMRIPINSYVDFALFYDGGSVVVNQPSANIDTKYRDAVGVGIRFNTPVGPVNIDYALKTYRKLYHSTCEEDDPSNPGHTRQVDCTLREGPGAFNFSIGTF